MVMNAFLFIKDNILLQFKLSNPVLPSVNSFILSILKSFPEEITYDGYH